jgi:hypothetical protein
VQPGQSGAVLGILPVLSVGEDLLAPAPLAPVPQQ